MSNYNEEKSKEAIIQTVLYHSRIDRTSNYVKILQGLQTYAYERSTFHIDSVITDISSGGGIKFSELLGLFGMVPGGVGRAAKGLKVLDFGTRAIELVSSGSQNGNINRIETEIRMMVNDIWNKSQDDPDLRAKINSYYPNHLGQFGDSFEEIISASPQFSDHIKQKLIEAEMMRSQDLLDEVDKNITELKNKVEGYLEAQIDEEKYQEELRLIHEYTVYGKLVSAIVSFENKELGQRVGLAVNAYNQISTTLTNLSANKITAGLATANIALITLSIASAFIDRNEDNGIGNALADLQDLIVKATEQILSRLDDIESRLIEIHKTLAVIYREIVEVGADIDDLHLKLDELTSLFTNKINLLINATRAGFGRDLDQAVIESVGHKDIWQPGYYLMTKDAFTKNLFTLYAHAASHSGDVLSTTLGNRSYIDKDLIDELNVVGFSSSTSYVSKALSVFSASSFPKVEVDPSMWVLSTEVLLDLIGDWPEYQGGVKTSFLKEIKLQGDSLIRFINSCDIAHAKDKYYSILSKSINAYERYLNAHNEYASSAFLKVLQGSGYTDPTILNDPNWKLFDEQSFPKLFSEGDMGVKPLTINASGLLGGNFDIQFTQDMIAKFLDPLLKCAAWYGGVFTGKFTQRNTAGIGTPAVYTFTLDLHLKLNPEGVEKTYRVMGAKEVFGDAPSGYHRGMTREEVFTLHLTRLLSKKENYNEYKTEVESNLKQLTSDLNPHFNQPCKQASALIRIDADKHEKTRVHKRAYMGLLELVWRGILFNSSQSVRTELEGYFLSDKYISDNLAGIYSDYKLEDKLITFRSHINNMYTTMNRLSSEPKIDTSEIPAWSVLKSIATHSRLTNCINTLENDERWVTPYGLAKNDKMNAQQ